MQSKMHYYWRILDNKYIKPCLIYDMETYMSSAKNELTVFRFNQENEEEFREPKSLKDLLNEVK